jgi:hypothetical protein
VHIPQDPHTDGGRWVSTLASDIRPRDKVRLKDVERHVLGRDYPPGHEPAYRLQHGNGIETVAKTSRVEIWDPDGSVIERVESLSGWAAVLAAASAINRIASGLGLPW